MLLVVNHRVNMSQKNNQNAQAQVFHFNQTQALIQQVQQILQSISTKKNLQIASTELQLLQEKFGPDFMKYLLRELIQEVVVKGDKKNQLLGLLNKELQKASQKPEFPKTFCEIAESINYENIGDFINDLITKLRPSYTIQILVALSLTQSISETIRSQSLEVLKAKLANYHNNGQPEVFPEYAVHHLLQLLNSDEDIRTAQGSQQVRQFLIDSYQQRQEIHPGMKLLVSQDLRLANASVSQPDQVDEIPLFEELFADQSLTSLQIPPWEALANLGHSATYNYNMLLSVLNDYKNLSEQDLALLLLNISLNHSGAEDLDSRIAQSTYEAQKKGDLTLLNKDSSNKKSTAMVWSIDCLARAFRELYTGLNWQKIFEQLASIKDTDITQSKKGIQLDQKGVQMLANLYSKCKPQNLAFPLQVLLESSWESKNLQFSLLEHCILQAQEKKDKAFAFDQLKPLRDSPHKTPRVHGELREIPGLNPPQELLQVWGNVDVLSKLIQLAQGSLYKKVRELIEIPLNKIPEHLVLTIAHLQFQHKGEQVFKASSLSMIDEILSHPKTMSNFLGSHPHSILILKELWKVNQTMVIRCICEICRNENKITNLSRVLDITQEIKESLIPIVSCSDYQFAFHLGVLAGKRDFLNYDVWLKQRIREIGTPFVLPLLKYINEKIVGEIQSVAEKNPDSVDETLKHQILEKSHLTQEKLAITLEHLKEISSRNSNHKIDENTQERIAETITGIFDIFPPSGASAMGQEKGVEPKANEIFQQMFNAEEGKEEEAIAQVIQTLKQFSESKDKTEKEVKACMLHSLFDEYRFLHKYPYKYLELISKLFGDVINEELADETLMVIALKFVFEAFRRDGKRQKFAIITLRRFWDKIPKQKEFFTNIYNNRHLLSESDPETMKEIEQLWDQENTKKKKDQPGRQKEEKKTKKAEVSSSVDPKVSTMTPESKSFQPAKDKGTFAQQQHLEQKFGDNKPTSKPEPHHHISASVDTRKELVTSQSVSIDAQPFVPKGNQGLKPQHSQVIGGMNISAPSFPLPNRAAGFNQPLPLSSPNPNMDMGGVSITNQRFDNTQIGNANQDLQSTQHPLKQQMDQTLALLVSKNDVTVYNILENHEINKGVTKEDEEKMSKFLQQVGKDTLQKKIKEIREVVMRNEEANLNWMIQTMLLRKVQQTAQVPMYILLLVQLENKKVYTFTAKQIHELYRKCCYINEPDFHSKMKVRAYSNPIQQHLKHVGAFFGQLTLQRNTPIIRHYLDLKYILYLSYTEDTLRLAIPFVVNILRKAKDSVFKRPNPWFESVISQLKEVKQGILSNANSGQHQDLMKEFELLAQNFQFNFDQVAPSKYFYFDHYSQGEWDVERQYMRKKSEQEEILLYQQMAARQAMLEAQQQEQASQSTLAEFEANDPFQTQPGASNLSTLSNASLQASQSVAATGLASSAATAATVPLAQSAADTQEQYLKLVEKVSISQEMQFPSNQIPELQPPNLKSLLTKALQKSIREILPPVVDRSVTIALITTTELVSKDFSYDKESQKVEHAANLTVKNLAGSLAAVTCREPLKMSLQESIKSELTNLKNKLTREGNAQVAAVLTEQNITEFSQLGSKENIDLGCKEIQNKVVQDALSKVAENVNLRTAIDCREKPLAQAPYYVPQQQILAFQNLPQQLRPNEAGLTQEQFRVYEDFNRLSQDSDIDQLLSEAMAGQETIEPSSDFSDVFKIMEIAESQQVFNHKDYYGKRIAELNLLANEKQEIVKELKENLKKILKLLCHSKSVNPTQSVTALVEICQSTVMNFQSFDLAAFCAQFYLESETYVQNNELNALLMKENIISPSTFSKFLATWVLDVQNATDKDQQMIYSLFEFLKEVLLTQKCFQAKNFEELINAIKHKMNTGMFQHQEIIISQLQEMQAQDMNGAFISKGELESYFNEFMELSQTRGTSKDEIDNFFKKFLEKMQLRESSQIALFCDTLAPYSIKRAFEFPNGEKRFLDRLDFCWIDGFIKLVFSLVSAVQTINKQELMNRLILSVKECLVKAHNKYGAKFSQKPYYKFFWCILNLLDQNRIFPVETQRLIFHIMAKMFVEINPIKLGAFAFAWLELVSDRLFVNKFLAVTQVQQSDVQQKMFFDYKEILEALYSYLSEYMDPRAASSEALKQYYQATMNVTVMLRNDYPDFLAAFHFTLANSLPPHCIQLKNLLLHAQPSAMSIPDPFNQELKVDLIPEIRMEPLQLCNFENYLHVLSIKEKMDRFVKGRKEELLKEVCSSLDQVKEHHQGRSRPNAKVINALVLYIEKLSFSAQPLIAKHECVQLIKFILYNISPETQKVFVDSMLNELRYPSTRTYHFNGILLTIFLDNASAESENIHSLIARSLLERLEVSEPHPWGLVIFFRELIQMQKYQFMSKRFIKENSKAVELLFETKLHKFKRFSMLSEK